MARPTAPIVALDLGGEARALLLDFNALAELEERGINLLGGFERNHLTAKNIRAIVWAACLHEEPNLTEKEVGSWLTPDRLEEVANKLVALFGVTLPEPEPASEGEDGDPLLEPASVGSSTG